MEISLLWKLIKEPRAPDDTTEGFLFFQIITHNE
jgi:hypothetical protein